MSDQKDIYLILQQWIEITKQEPFDPVKFKEMRSLFGKLERKTFGDVSERIKNPVAMQYDKVRNMLVNYSENKDLKYLRLAVEAFSQIQKPS